jgi:hypothetical protein
MCTDFLGIRTADVEPDPNIRAKRVAACLLSCSSLLHFSVHRSKNIWMVEAFVFFQFFNGHENKCARVLVTSADWQWSAALRAVRVSSQFTVVRAQLYPHLNALRDAESGCLHHAGWNVIRINNFYLCCIHALRSIVPSSGCV